MMSDKEKIEPDFHLKQDNLLAFFFAGLVFLILMLLTCLLWLKHLNYHQMLISNARYESYRISNLLRRTSDDLTTMARLYVITKNKKYLDHYHEILSIRNGTSPRPERYDDIYWDLVVNHKRPSPYGKKLSFDQIMIKQDFSLQEFNLLRQAQELSDEMTLIEMSAFKAARGKNSNQNLAIDLLFGQDYMNAKAKVMAPIQLFIEEVNDRTKKMHEKIVYDTNLLITIAIGLSILTTFVIFISMGKAMRRIEKTAHQNELLLLNLFPPSVSDRLKRSEKMIADEFPQVSALFCDIVGFTSMTQTIGTIKMFDLLGNFFDEMDTLTQKYGVEKIKTVGDSYMAVSGLPEPAADHAIRMANFALSINEVVKQISQSYQLKLQVRIGMTYGAAIAGVIGHKKFIYDVWGDVVNTASRMEHTGVPGKIHITEKMALLLEDLFIIEKHKVVDVKGKGKMYTYFLKGHREVE